MKYNLQILDEYVEKGLLRKAEDGNLVQYNYSDLCNNASAWDEITLNNRGNIYEKSTGLLVAKAMPKFMNFSQLPEDKQNWFLQQTPISTEKMDGCLGIIYTYDGKLRYNSRGSFNNYVTETIERLLSKYCMVKKLAEHNTLIVEVISPQTKIICDYKGEEALYLLTAYSKLDWKEIDIQGCDLIAQIMRMPRPKITHQSWQELFSWQRTTKLREEEKEGFVVICDGERVKIKSEEYLNLARVLSGFSKRALWKLWKIDLEQGTNKLQDYAQSLPDEVFKDYEKYYNELKDELKIHINNVMLLADALKHIETRDLSVYFQKYPSVYQSPIYMLRAGKDMNRYLIKLIEPKEEEVC